MPTTFAEQLLEMADDFGLLRPADARAAVIFHGLKWSDWVASRPMGALLCEVRPLLSWLGY
jgi:hypothetical protein